MNLPAKIALEPLTFEAFNALDVLVGAEIVDLAYQVRKGEAPRPSHLLERLREVRRVIDRARPADYVDAIRASRAESVCDT